jgi:hypothetical protein
MQDVIFKKSESKKEKLRFIFQLFNSRKTSRGIGGSRPQQAKKSTKWACLEEAFLATQISESMLASQKKSKKSKIENVNQIRNQKNTQNKKRSNLQREIKNTN